jgi:HK97 gp10 family phage protein
MAFGINLTGIKEVENALKTMDKHLRQDVGDEINSSALKIMSDAKRLAPIDLGFLRGQISIEPVNDLTYEVEAKAKYSAYIEFGTGGEVRIPAGYEDLAKIFKGKGLRTINIRPQPFLIPSFETEKPKLIQRLKKLLDAKS